MAQRTGCERGTRDEPGPSSMASLRQTKEQQAVPACAGELSSKRAQRGIALGIALKCIRQYLDHDLAAPILTPKQATHSRQAWIPFGINTTCGGQFGARTDDCFARTIQLNPIGDLADSEA